jgi:type IV secretory pathway VirB10-like protein
VNLLANEGDMSWYYQPFELMPVASVNHASSEAQMTKALVPTASALPTESEIPSITPDSVAAMAAPIGSNQLIVESQPAASNQIKASDSDNDQANSSLQNPNSPYVIQAGALIPGVLVTGIYSDLPGPIIAQVRVPVYDSISGEHLLIPQGTKLIGGYDTQVAYGQERLLVVWKRLLLPNGQSLDLPSLPGTDVAGTAGFYDHTNHHYTKLFGSAVLTSILGAGVACNQSLHQADRATADPVSLLSKNLGESVMQTGLKLTEKNIDLRPTVEIRPGYHFQLVVTQDLVFEGSYGAKGASKIKMD